MALENSVTLRGTVEKEPSSFCFHLKTDDKNFPLAVQTRWKPYQGWEEIAVNQMVRRLSVLMYVLRSVLLLTLLTAFHRKARKKIVDERLDIFCQVAIWHEYYSNSVCLRIQ